MSIVRISNNYRQVNLRCITRLAFRNRFTLAELATVDLASIDDPSAAMEDRVRRATLRVFQTKVSEAQFIDLDDEQTQNGVWFLEQLGVIAPGRANEIINTPVEPRELYV